MASSQNIIKIGLLICVLAVWVYGAVWGVRALEYYRARSAYRQDVRYADSIGYMAPQPVGLTWSSGMLGVITDQIKVLQGQRQALQTSIEQYEKRLLSTMVQQREEQVQLEKQLINLGLLTPSETQDRVITLSDPVAVYTETKRLEATVSNAQRTIKQYADRRKAEGAFVNPLWSYTNKELKALIATLTSAQKASQLLIFPVEGHQLTRRGQRELQELQPGGVIIMGSNVRDAKQVASLMAHIQATNEKIPLFTTVDQEGGPVARIGWDRTPGAAQFAKVSPGEVCKLAATRSTLLASLGLNVNLAPVVDLTYPQTGFINERTISSNKDVVTSRARSFVECSQSAGVITTIKHYPGHGATPDDSHLTLPVITKSKEAWLRTDAVPFKELTQSKMLMVGHLLMKHVDARHPASQSRILITDILRNKFGYQGVIVTDDMQQLHRITNISASQGLLDAYNAGIDVALYVGLPRSREELVNTTTRYINEGKISTQRVDESVLRVLQLKREIH